MPRKRAGFSMIEVLMALVVLSVGILGVMEAFSLSLRVTGDTERLEEAVGLARRRLEEVMVTPLGTPVLGRRTSGGFESTVELAPMPHGLVRGSVLIRWSVRGKARQFRLSQVFRPVE